MPVDAQQPTYSDSIISLKTAARDITNKHLKSPGLWQLLCAAFRVFFRKKPLKPAVQALNNKINGLGTNEVQLSDLFDILESANTLYNTYFATGLQPIIEQLTNILNSHGKNALLALKNQAAQAQVLEAQVRDLTSENQNLRQQVREKGAENDKLTTQVDTLSRQRDEEKKCNEATKRELAGKISEVDNLAQKIVTMKDEHAIALQEKSAIQESGALALAAQTSKLAEESKRYKSQYEESNAAQLRAEGIANEYKKQAEKLSTELAGLTPLKNRNEELEKNIQSLQPNLEKLQRQLTDVKSENAHMRLQWHGNHGQNLPMLIAAAQKIVDEQQQAIEKLACSINQEPANRLHQPSQTNVLLSQAKEITKTLKGLESALSTATGAEMESLKERNQELEGQLISLNAHLSSAVEALDNRQSSAAPVTKRSSWLPLYFNKNAANNADVQQRPTRKSRVGAAPPRG